MTSFFSNPPADMVRAKKPKGCYCGGHSMRDSKKNLHHHSTAARLAVRRLRRLKLAWRCASRRSQIFSAWFRRAPSA